MTIRDISKFFRSLRNDDRHHLGLGDVRLTLAQQDEIAEKFAAMLSRIDISDRVLCVNHAGKDQIIDCLWEQSNHGTQREDIEAAYEAGAKAERDKLTGGI